MNSRASIHSSGPYEIEHIKTDTYGVFTNNIHSGAMRGYSSPSLIFGQEQLIEELAETLGIDEVEIRRINCLKDGSLTTTGVPVHHVILQQIMDETVEETDYVSKHAKYQKQTDTFKRKGIGMAICYRGCRTWSRVSGCIRLYDDCQRRWKYQYYIRNLQRMVRD